MRQLLISNLASTLKTIGLLVLLVTIIQPYHATSAQRAYGIELCSEVVEFEGEAYFCGNHRRFGRELFRSNGTTEGTAVVADISQGPSDSEPVNLFKLAGKLYFFAQTVESGRELWSSDGTEEGTVLVKETRAGVNGISPLVEITVGENVVYFTGERGVWRSDGSTAGTVLAVSRNQGELLATMNDDLFYQQRPASNSQGDLLLFRINEAMQTRQLVKNFGSGCDFLSAEFSEEEVAKNVTNDHLFVELFCSGTGESGESIISTDGSEAGTRAVLTGSSSYLGELHNRRFYFSFGSRTFRHTNGSDLATLDLCSIEDSACSFDFGSKAEVNGKLLLSLTSSEFTRSFWSTNGSIEGSTKLLVGNVGLPFVLSESAVFIEGISNQRLWITNGTAAGTRPLLDVESLVAVQVKDLGSRLVFLFNQPESGILRLYSSNGTQSGTQLLRTFNGVFRGEFTSVEGNSLYFSSGGQVWHSDGTVQGTYELNYLDDPALGAEGETGAQSVVPVLNLLLGEEEE